MESSSSFTKSLSSGSLDRFFSCESSEDESPARSVLMALGTKEKVEVVTVKGGPTRLEAWMGLEVKNFVRDVLDEVDPTPEEDVRESGIRVSDAFRTFNQAKMVKEKQKLENLVVKYETEKQEIIEKYAEKERRQYHGLRRDQIQDREGSLLAKDRYIAATKAHILAMEKEIEEAKNPVYCYEEEAVEEHLPEEGALSWQRGDTDVEVALLWEQRDGSIRRDPIDLEEQYRVKRKQEEDRSWDVW